jgi:signal transduction histidine kinase
MDTAERRLRRASDGAFRWHLVQAVRVPHPEDGQDRWLGTLTDIHDQKIAEEKQRLFAMVSQELRRQLEAREMTFNALFRRALETGKPILFSKITEEDISKYTSGDEAHARLLYGLGVSSGIVVPLIAREHKLGLIVMHYGPSGRAYHEEDLAAAEEFAHRAAIALDNARLYQKAQEAVRSREEFLSIASHELRTPLAALSLIHERMEGLVGGLGISGDIPQLLTRCDGNVRSLTHLVDTLLDVTRIRQGQLEMARARVDLVALARDVISRHSFGASGVTLRADGEAEVTGFWDPARVEQIITNLVLNAVKYGRGRPIEVGVRASEDGRLAWLSVSDQGIGIAPEDLGKLFRIFERINRGPGSEGLGLGLYISQRIAEAHGGRITVESGLGQGSVFTVELPRAGHLII